MEMIRPNMVKKTWSSWKLQLTHDEIAIEFIEDILWDHGSSTTSASYTNRHHGYTVPGI